MHLNKCVQLWQIVSSFQLLHTSDIEKHEKIMKRVIITAFCEESML